MHNTHSLVKNLLKHSWPKQVHGIFHVHLMPIHVNKTVSNIPNQNGYLEICPTVVTRRKKSLFISLPNSKLTISLIYIYKHYAIDVADPSSMQDACHMNFVIELAHHCLLSSVVENWSAKSEGLRFDSEFFLYPTLVKI